MRKLFFISVLLLISLEGFAQWSAVIPNSRTGYAAVAEAAVWSPFQNPATLACIAPVEAGIFYGNRFTLSEMATKGGQVGVATKPVNAGVSLSHFGYSQYSEMLLGASLARRFSDRWALGLQFNYYSTMLSPAEGSRGTLLVQIGLIAQPIEHLTIGFQAFNPVQAEISDLSLSKNAPAVYSLGGKYQFTEKFSWNVQLDKEVRSKLLGSTLFSYQVVDALAVRVGGYVEPFVPMLGAGTKFKNLELNVNAEYHNTLGLSWASSLVYRLPVAKREPVAE